MATKITASGGLVPITGADGTIQWQAWDYGELLNHLNSDLTPDASIIPTPQNGQWINATYLNAWTTGGGTTPAQFMKDALGFVHLRGRIIGGATSTVAFNLPAGYRSAEVNSTYPIAGFNGATPGAALLAFAPAAFGLGNVAIFYAAGFTDIGISGVTFLAEL